MNDQLCNPPVLGIASELETRALAREMAALLQEGDCVCLYGDLGVGKTTFARAVIESLLAEPEEIPSPSFTLVQTYETVKGSLWHCDFYRLTSEEEAFELGLEDAFSGAITIIEWPERIAALLPEQRLELHWALSKDSDSRRELRLTAKGHWQSRLKSLKFKI